MASKKQIIIPVIILTIGVGAFFVFSGMKKPPAEKPKVDNTPLVTVSEVSLNPIRLDVKSYGVVKAKYETELVAQVSGEIVEISHEFVRGAFVKKGEVLAQIDPSDYQAALIDAEAKLASAKAALKQEIAHGKVAEKEWKRITETSPTELSLRKPQLAKELSNVKAAEARVMIAKRNLERTEIKAPYDALIEKRHLGLGAYLAKGAKLGKVLATDIAEVRLPVAENEMQFLTHQGNNASVILSANIAGKMTNWQASIVRSEGVIDSKSRMNYLVAEITDPYGLLNKAQALRFGTYVNAEIAGLTLENVAVIPRYLLLDNGIPVLDQDNKLQFVEVDIVRQQGRNIIVKNGLASGDKIITTALDYPLSGMQLALSTPTDIDPNDNDTSLAKTLVAATSTEKSEK